MKKKIVVLLSLILIMSVFICACGSNFEKDIVVQGWKSTSYDKKVEIELRNNSSEDVSGIKGTLILYNADKSCKDTLDFDSADFQIPAGTMRAMEFDVSTALQNRGLAGGSIRIDNVNGIDVDIYKDFWF